MGDVLKFMYSMIQKQYQHLNKVSITIQNNLEIPNISNIPKPSETGNINFQIIPKNIRQHIEKHSKSYIHYVLRFPHFTYAINIYFICETGHINTAIYYTNVRNMALWILTIIDVHRIASKNVCIRSDINIYVYQSAIKKSLPSNFREDSIGRTHINSAFTTNCNSNPIIVIFREEEWYKVFIHETFHLFGMDFSGTVSSKNQTQRMNDLFCIHSNQQILLFEAYTEFWARIMNVLLVSVIKHPTISANIAYDSSITPCMILEKQHSITQMVKILRFMGLTYSDIISCTNKSVLYKENTNVLAYFILTSILLVDYLYTLKNIKKINNSNTFIFNNNETNQMHFLKLIGDQSTNDELFQLIATTESKKETDSFLRMCHIKNEL